MAWTVSIKTWITGEIVTAAQLNTELKDRAQHLFDNLLPCGSVVPFAGSIAPSFYLFCNGQGAATTAWPTLFGLIGYTYGGSGTTFNMPDLKGRVPVGAGAGAGLTTRTLASIFGAENVATPLPQHAHGVSDPGHGHGNDAHDHHNDGANATSSPSASAAEPMEWCPPARRGGPTSSPTHRKTASRSESTAAAATSASRTTAHPAPPIRLCSHRSHSTT
jgi:microcystin-dependent protein